MRISAFPRFVLLAFVLISCSPSAQADSVPHKLAIGTTYIGGQVHWGFAKKWAVEVRSLKSEDKGQEGTVKAEAVGARGYYYFRPPSRVRFFMGLEGASTKSFSSQYNFQTSGTAFGAFMGTELYLMRRLSVGVDVGPYILSSKVKDARINNGDGDMYFVINSFMNFYFL